MVAAAAAVARGAVRIVPAARLIGAESGKHDRGFQWVRQCSSCSHGGFRDVLALGLGRHGLEIPFAFQGLETPKAVDQERPIEFDGPFTPLRLLLILVFVLEVELWEWSLRILCGQSLHGSRPLHRRGLGLLVSFCGLGSRLVVFVVRFQRPERRGEVILEQHHHRGKGQRIPLFHVQLALGLQQRAHGQQRRVVAPPRSDARVEELAEHPVGRGAEGQLPPHGPGPPQKGQIVHLVKGHRGPGRRIGVFLLEHTNVFIEILQPLLSGRIIAGCCAAGNRGRHLVFQFSFLGLQGSDLDQYRLEVAQCIHVLGVVGVELDHVLGGDALIQVLVLGSVPAGQRLVDGLEGVPEDVCGRFHAHLQQLAVGVNE
mmetsp:Transcript_8994/g.26728  ORF Transcript_8994/g.26728 Transcript_8994/m.26728 type:complete len:371 (+) Transcript_8994:1421-2533(+)